MLNRLMDEKLYRVAVSVNLRDEPLVATLKHKFYLSTTHEEAEEWAGALRAYLKSIGKI